MLVTTPVNHFVLDHIPYAAQCSCGSLPPPLFFLSLPLVWSHVKVALVDSIFPTNQKNPPIKKPAEGSVKSRAMDPHTFSLLDPDPGGKNLKTTDCREIANKCNFINIT